MFINQNFHWTSNATDIFFLVFSEAQKTNFRPALLMSERRRHFEVGGCGAQSAGKNYFPVCLDSNTDYNYLAPGSLAGAGADLVELAVALDPARRRVVVDVPVAAQDLDGVEGDLRSLLGVVEDDARAVLDVARVPRMARGRLPR